MLWRSTLVLLASALAYGETPAVELARTVRDAGADTELCFRVRDLAFAKEDLRLYFNDGYLLFAKPVQGKRLWFAYSGENEGGDAEVIVIPPHRSERRSLASFAGTPNLDEHFRSAFFVATDDSIEALLSRARDIGTASPEQGILMRDTYDQVARSLSESFSLRLVQDLMNAGRQQSGLFFGTLGTNTKGNVDVLYDPSAREQIVVGQVAAVNGRPTFNVWCSFQSRSVRNGKPTAPDPFTTPAFQIEANLDANLRMTATTRIKIKVAGEPIRALPFLISGRMHVVDALVDGKPAEVFSRESLRETAIRGGGDDLFLVVASDPIGGGAEHEIAIRHEGDVVLNAGNRVYYVGSRGTWYPHRDTQFSRHDLLFRYPKQLTLVGTGAVVEDKTEGETRTTHCVSEAPIRFAGFNLGEYNKVTVSKPGYTIEVYGNRSVEPGLARRAAMPQPPPNMRPNRRLGDPDLPIAMTVPAPDPTAHLRELADRLQGAVEFMSTQFGPPPVKTITVSPIPGFFGQGFPGLVYMSTFSYLSTQERGSAGKDRVQETFFSDILPAHEIAHQWWGNLVTAEAYQDEWLMEALANYSALMYMERRRGAKALEQSLEDFRAHLIARKQDGNTVESTGPITWGIRLRSAGEEPWRAITYEKGAWILHMLRRHMGDEQFSKLLGEFARRYAYKSVTTDDFRRMAAKYLPPHSADPTLENFFETWVYGTGIPALKLDYAVRGKAPSVRVTGAVAQSEVDDEFSADVPVEIVPGRGSAPVVKWLRTSDQPATFTLSLKQPPSRVAIVPQAVLSTKK